MSRKKVPVAQSPVIESPAILVPLKTAAAMLGCSPRTIRNCVYRGNFIPSKTWVGLGFLTPPSCARSR